MTAPPKGLRAHEAGTRLRQLRSERFLPTLGAHASGITAERRHSKTVEHILAGLAGEPAAELDCVPVHDPALLERRTQCRLVELRVMTRAGEASHVDEGADPRLADNRDELSRRTSSVPDRPDRHRAG
jgi:hypothetical protein